jgi:hypothetical protein
VRVFKIKWFARYARDERISDESLWEAVERAQRGLVDADLGGHVIKQRVARKGQGRSSGYRVLIGYEAGRRGVFIFCFSKNTRENITTRELESFKRLAASWLTMDDRGIEHAIKHGELVEVKDDKTKET